jgi:hypothetical protein
MYMRNPRHADTDDMLIDTYQCLTIISLQATTLNTKRSHRARGHKLIPFFPGEQKDMLDST